MGNLEKNHVFNKIFNILLAKCLNIETIRDRSKKSR